MDRYDHKRHVYRLPETTRKAISEAIDEYMEGDTYIVAVKGNTGYYIDDDELFEALGLK